MTFKEELEARIQRYRAKAEEFRIQKEAIERQLQSCETLLEHWEGALQAEAEIEQGVELPTLEEISAPVEEILHVSVPKAVEEIMTELGRPAGVKEISQRIQAHYPNLQVRSLAKLVNVALTRPPSGDRYERTGRGIYRLRRAE